LEIIGKALSFTVSRLVYVRRIQEALMQIKRALRPPAIVGWPGTAADSGLGEFSFLNQYVV